MAINNILWPNGDTILWPNGDTLEWFGTGSYIAFSLTDPNSIVTEPTWPSYERINQDFGTWKAVGDTSTYTGVEPFVYPTIDGNINAYYTIPYFVVYDSPIGGNVITFGSINPSITVGYGDTISFLPGNFTIDFDDTRFAPHTDTNAFATVTFTPITPTFAPGIFSISYLYNRHMRS